MSHTSNEYDSSGPRPPIPGEETSRSFKMIDTFMTSSSSSNSSNATPPCLQWARTLANLLEDREGAELFKAYVESESGIHKERLNFYFACEGLKQESDPEKTKKIIGLIYSKILKKSDLHVPNDVKQLVKAGLKDEVTMSPRIYDQMQKEVKRIIQETTYPNFLQSEMYLNYVQQATQGIPFINDINATTTTTISSMAISESCSKFHLSRSSTLPTLMEEGDASSLTDHLSDLAEGAVGFSNEPMSRMPLNVSSTKIPLSLTKDALMATQRRRLEMRSPGTHSAYNINNYAPYNPVSRRDSELASLSSGRTDSDTMSISSMSTTDGRPHQRRHHHHHHHPTALEKRMIRENACADTETQFVIPRTQRVDAKSQNLSTDEFLKILLPKLEAVKKEQERMELLNKKLLEVEQSKSNKLFVDAISAKLMLDDDKDDQDILDQHVSRVWSDRTPHRSPGNLSPGNSLFQRRKPYDIHMSASSSMQSSLRVSKSIPESSIRKFTKWGSVNTDSGISLFSSDTMTIKHKDAMSISSTSSGNSTSRNRSGTQAQESISGYQKQLEEVRRTKRYQQQPPLPQKTPSVPPPIPAKNVSQNVSSQHLVQQSILLPQLQQSQPYLNTEHMKTVVYSFCDEDVPYRIKIPGNSPITLKQFKDFLPKKGQYRFFFKTRCDDEELVIQEEVTNDSDVLPLFDGKVVANIKPAN